MGVHDRSTKRALGVVLFCIDLRQRGHRRIVALLAEEPESTLRRQWAASRLTNVDLGLAHPAGHRHRAAPGVYSWPADETLEGERA